jgi:effector-binding domain-containing protein
MELMFINPKYRGLRLGRRLYDVRKELCEQLNLKSIIFAGRIPSYGKYKDEITPKVYIEKSRKRNL